LLKSSIDFAETGIGTPFFLSPEICKGEKYNFKSDIWMLGCLIYELCFLKRPFEGESISMIMIQIMNINPNFNTDLHKCSYSNALIELVSKCLSKNPQERPRIEEILIIAQKSLQAINAEEYQAKKFDNLKFKQKDFNGKSNQTFFIIFI